jgi:hypothetical protein
VEKLLSSSSGKKGSLNDFMLSKRISHKSSSGILDVVLVKLN